MKNEESIDVLREAWKRQREVEIAKAVAETEERINQNTQEKPCFAEIRKNGLNCNRSDLHEIRKFPPVSSPDRSIEISIKKCRQCRQIYKEIFEVAESTKQSRSRFLKPGEIDLQSGIGFSAAEAEEYYKENFLKLLNPLLGTESPAPENISRMPDNSAKIEFVYDAIFTCDVCRMLTPHKLFSEDGYDEETGRPHFHSYYICQICDARKLENTYYAPWW